MDSTIAIEHSEFVRKQAGASIQQCRYESCFPAPAMAWQQDRTALPGDGSGMHENSFVSTACDQLVEL